MKQLNLIYFHYYKKLEPSPFILSIKETNFAVKLRAEVKIKPEVFLLDHGIFFAFVRFPAPYDVRTISDVFCDGAPAIRKQYIPGLKQMMFIFRKQDIKEKPIDKHFIARGHLNNNYLFEGTDDIIRIIPKDSKSQNTR